MSYFINENNFHTSWPQMSQMPNTFHQANSVKSNPSQSNPAESKPVPPYSYFFPSDIGKSDINKQILEEVDPDEANIPHDEESVEELCTTECHSDNYQCNLNQNQCLECLDEEDGDEEDDDDEEDGDEEDGDEEDGDEEDGDEEDGDEEENDENDDDEDDDDEEDGVDFNSEADVSAKVDYNKVNYNTLDDEIKKIQSELEQKLKMQREYKEQLEKERLQKEQVEKERMRKEQAEKEAKLKSEKRTVLVNDINKIVAEYNEQQKKCDTLLKTYNLENNKLTQMNLEYYKLTHQLNLIDKPSAQIEYDTMNSFLFPFLNLLQGK